MNMGERSPRPRGPDVPPGRRPGTGEENRKEAAPGENRGDLEEGGLGFEIKNDE